MSSLFNGIFRQFKKTGLSLSQICIYMLTFLLAGLLCSVLMDVHEERKAYKHGESQANSVVERTPFFL